MVPSMIDKAGTPLEHSSASLGSRLWCAGALGTYSSITLWSGDMSLSKASSMTWTKDTILMIEKTRTPIGSSLKSREVREGIKASGRFQGVGTSRGSLTAYGDEILGFIQLYWSWRLISQVVVQTMAVERKSRTASTRLASTDTEGTEKTTTAFPAKRIALAAKLT